MSRWHLPSNVLPRSCDICRVRLQDTACSRLLPWSCFWKHPCHLDWDRQADGMQNSRAPWHSWRGFSSVQFSHSVVSNSLRPHESQHARPPCPSPTPGVHWDSHPLSQWCHPAISSSVVPFSSCPQSLPASESFPMSQLFAWDSQSTGVSALASFLPKKSRADLLQKELVGSPCRGQGQPNPTSKEQWLCGRRRA